MIELALKGGAIVVANKMHKIYMVFGDGALETNEDRLFAVVPLQFSGFKS